MRESASALVRFLSNLQQFPLKFHPAKARSTVNGSATSSRAEASSQGLTTREKGSVASALRFPQKTLPGLTRLPQRGDCRYFPRQQSLGPARRNSSSFQRKIIFCRSPEGYQSNRRNPLSKRPVGHHRAGFPYKSVLRSQLHSEAVAVPVC